MVEQMTEREWIVFVTGIVAGFGMSVIVFLAAVGQIVQSTSHIIEGYKVAASIWKRSYEELKKAKQ